MTTRLCPLRLACPLALAIVWPAVDSSAARASGVCEPPGVASAVPDEVAALNERASALQASRRHAEALALFDQALALQAPRDSKSRLYAVLLSNSAECLHRLGRADEALTRFEAAEAIYAAAKPFTLGFSSAEKAAHERGATLYRMGGTLNSRKRYHDAVRALNEALRLFRDVPGALIEQADCLAQIGQAQAAADPELKEIAATSLEEAIGLYEQVGANTPTYAQALSSLGSILLDLKRIPEAGAAMLRAVRADWRFATEALPIMTDDQRQFLQLAVGASADPLYSLAFGNAACDAATGFEAALLAKGMLHESALLERRALLQGAPESIRELWRQQAELRSRLAAMTLEPALQPLSLAPDDGTTRQQQMEVLRQRIAALDGQLRQDDQAGELLRSARLEPVSSAAVTCVLHPGQVLLEYVRYRAGDGPAAVERYGVFVLASGRKPIAADLGPAAAIDAAITAYRARLEEDIHRFGGMMPSTPQVRRAEKALADLGVALRALLVDPIAAHLGDAKRCYVSPDALIGLVPFEALPTDATEGNVVYLVESRRFVYLATSRDLLRAGTPAQASGGRAVLIGNPAFGASPRMRATALAGLTAPVEDGPVSDPTATPTTMGSGPGQRTVEVPQFGALPGTGQFLSTIRPWLESQSIRVEVLTDVSATEESVFRSGSPRILQFATHGYFTGRSADTDAGGHAFSGYVRSMLILAGANRHDQPRQWVRVGDGLITLEQARARGMTADQIAAARVEVSNGLLTALEVLGMDLSSTELVGLTACETGLGEATAGEGIVGLRRAFLLAGARSIVMSLWEVPLEETMALHERFYQGWLRERLGRFDAFADARHAALSQARLSRNGVAHPFYWAGFVYAGDPGDPPAPTPSPKP